MPKAIDLTPDSRFFALFVGPSGDGKKSAAASWSKLGPLRYWDFDMRIRGLLGSPWVDRKEIDYIPFPPQSTDKKAFYTRLNEECDSLYGDIERKQCKYKTLVVGSITGETRSLLGDSLKISYNSGGTERTLGRTLGTLRVAGMENFRFINNATMQTLSFLQSLPINVIVLAHTVPIFRPEDPEDDYSPAVPAGHKLALSDSMGALVPGLFDNVFRFERKVTGTGNSTKVKFFVEFKGQLARTTFSSLPKGEHDITEKNFYEELQVLLSKGNVIK